MHYFRTLIILNHAHKLERIKNANKTYSMLQKFLKNKNIPKKLKLRLKNTTIDKTLTYASETGTLTKRDRKQLNIF
jgi:ribosomal protein L31E